MLKTFPASMIGCRIYHAPGPETSNMHPDRRQRTDRMTEQRHWTDPQAEWIGGKDREAHGRRPHILHR